MARVRGSERGTEPDACSDVTEDEVSTDQLSLGIWEALGLQETGDWVQWTAGGRRMKSYTLPSFGDMTQIGPSGLSLAKRVPRVGDGLTTIVIWIAGQGRVQCSILQLQGAGVQVSQVLREQLRTVVLLHS